MSKLQKMQFSAILSNEAADVVGWYGGHYAVLAKTNRSRRPFEEMSETQRQNEIDKNFKRVRKRHKKMNAALDAKGKIHV